MVRDFAKTLMVSSSVTLMFAATGAQAQTSGTDGTLAATDGEIIVTATRRSESSFSAPASISALSADELADRGVSGIDDLQYQAPGIQFGQSGGISTIFIRGVGLNEGSGSTSPGVAVYVDGIYQPRPSTGDLAQTDLERVEVLRGPQGTLYGRNATGGVINFISKAPTDRNEGYLTVGYANYDEIHAEGAMNFVLGDDGALRAVGSYRKRSDGFVENIRPGGRELDTVDSLSGRVRLRVDLSADATFDLGAYAIRERNYTYNAFLYPYGAEAIFVNPILGTATLAARPNRTAANEGDPLARNLRGIDGRLEFNLGDVRATSLTSYVYHRWGFERFDNDASDIDFMLFQHDETSRTFTQQLDLAAKVGTVDLVGGAFYINDRFFEAVPFTVPLGIVLSPGDPNDPVNNPRVTGVPGARIYTAQRKHTESGAFYVDATIGLTDTLKVNGGARYSRETSDVSQNIQIDGLLVNGFPTGTILSCPNVRTRLEYNSVTWRGGAQFTPSPSVNFYGSVSRGFKTGGVNIAECADQFEPETVTSYELGLKGKLGTTLTVGMSLFHYDYKNLQIFQFLPLATLIQNAPKATVNGAEIEAVFKPDRNWTFTASGTFLDTQYASFKSFDDLNRAAGEQDLKGNRLNYSPPYAINAAVQYATPQFSFGTLIFRGEARLIGKQYFRPYNLPLDAQEDYQLFNASLIWDSPDSKFRARAYVRNIGQEGYIQTLGSSGTFGSRYGSYGAPRQYGFELTAKF